MMDAAIARMRSELERADAEFQARPDGSFEPTYVAEVFGDEARYVLDALDQVDRLQRVAESLRYIHAEAQERLTYEGRDEVTLENGLHNILAEADRALDVGTWPQ
jgi:hypothetical protein